MAEPVKRHWRDELDYWSTPVMANLLWVLLSIPVITSPLALIGLLGVMYRWMDDRDPPVFQVFFGTIQQTWRKCYIVLAIDLVIGGIVYLNLRILQDIETTNILPLVSRSVTLFVASILLLMNIYLWTLLSVWNVSLKTIVKFSLQLVFAQPLWSLVIAFIFAVTIFTATFFPGIVFVAATGAIVAYIASRGTRFVASKYLSREQFTLLEFH